MERGDMESHSRLLESFAGLLGANCYAETAHRVRLDGKAGYAPFKPWTPENAAHNVRVKPGKLLEPLSWRRPRMVFVNSMSDMFHEQIPPDTLDEVFGVMAACHALDKGHVFQILTKRPEEALTYLGGGDTRDRIARSAAQRCEDGDSAYDLIAMDGWPLPNVWLGVSIENARYTWRADILRKIPAALRFISAEPLLGSLFEPDLGVGPISDPLLGARSRFKRLRPLDLTGISWVICGGESGGPKARPTHPQWLLELRDCCVPHGPRSSLHAPIPFFFKQWGSWAPVPPTGGVRVGDVCLSEDGERYDVDDSYVCAPNETEGEWLRYYGAGWDSGGNVLDGETWEQIPEPDRPQATLL